MPPPALAVGRRSQQAVDQPFVSIGCFVGQKGIDFLEGRGQSRQVESHPADQGWLARLGGRGQAMVQKCLLDEAVDRVLRPVDRRRPAWRTRERLAAAPATATTTDGWRLQAATLWLEPMSSRLCASAVAAGPGRSERDPARQHRDFLRRELAGGRHLEPLVVNCLDEQTLVGLAGHDRRPAFTALEDRLQRIEPQTAFLLLAAVA